MLGPCPTGARATLDQRDFETLDGQQDAEAWRMATASTSAAALDNLHVRNAVVLGAQNLE